LLIVALLAGVEVCRAVQTGVTGLIWMAGSRSRQATHLVLVLHTLSSRYRRNLFGGRNLVGDFKLAALPEVVAALLLDCAALISSGV
jgi:hypothetical protein